MMKLKNGLFLLVAAASLIAVTSCGTKKVVAEGGKNTSLATSNEKKQNKVEEDAAVSGIEQMNFLRKVSDNAVYAQNIVSKIKCTINTGSNDLSVGGSLHMRKDKVIRIQITPFGLMEAGRLEFTKDYVLFVDRIHKEYVKATYSEVDFLKNNGLDFYALQALFWNHLFVPGMQNLPDSSLKEFRAQLTGAPKTRVVLSKGKMNYVWTADSKTALVNSLNATYAGGNNGNTSVNCSYSAFKQLGTKQFPTDITLTMSTKAVKNASKMMLRLQLGTISTDGDWEEKTTVSSKYKQVKMETLLGKLSNMM